MDTKHNRQPQSINRTKKKQQGQRTALDKANIWALLDKDKEDAEVKNSSLDMECVYQKDTCQSCKSPLITMEDGFPTCSNKTCGRLYREVLDFSPEWRFYGADDKNANDPTRCGNPINPLLQESSLGCKVLYNSKSTYEMRCIGRWTEWQSIPHTEKTLYNDFMHISTMAHNGGIPKICVDEACSIRKDLSEQQMFRGCNRAGVIAGSVYIACRLNGCPRTACEIAEIFHLDKASSTNGCALALELYNTVYRNNGADDAADLGSTCPSDFIERYCSRLNVSKEQTMLCLFIANVIQEQNLIPDNTPNSVAAGIVFFVCQLFQLNRSKAEIKSICNVSEVTINKCYKKIDAMKHKIVPSCFLGA